MRLEYTTIEGTELMDELAKLKQFLTFMLQSRPEMPGEYFAREPHPTHMREASELIRSCHDFAMLAKKFDVESVLLAATRLSVATSAPRGKKDTSFEGFSDDKESFVAP